MRAHFATNRPNDIKVFPCDVSVSFYDFIDSLFDDCEGAGPMHRACSLLRKLKVTHYVREFLLLDEELSAEIADLRTALSEDRKRGTNTFHQITRFTFFRSEIESPDWRQISSEDVLGYIVFVDFQYRTKSNHRERIKYIYESVIRLPQHFDSESKTTRSLTNHYFHVAKIFKSTIGTKKNSIKLKIPGTYFCQQNGVSHVCAHAALRMAINSSPRVADKNFVTPRTINTALGLELKRSVIMKGLNGGHFKTFAKSRGFGAVSIDLYAEPKSSYSTYPYRLIETGIPTLLCINGRNNRRNEDRNNRGKKKKKESEDPAIYSHAVAVVGHTMNTDRWTPEARVSYYDFGAPKYIPASAWTDHFLINDDNMGMHCSLPSESLVSNLIPEEDPHMRITEVFGLVPKGVKNYATVEASAAMLIKEMLESFKKRRDLFRRRGIKMTKWAKSLEEKLVTRPLLLSRGEYAKHLNAISHMDTRELATEFPRYVWLVELTEPNLYSANRRKLGEVVYGANVKDERPLLVWIPGISLGIDTHTGGLEPMPWPIKSHVPLYVPSKRLQPTSDW